MLSPRRWHLSKDLKVTRPSHVGAWRKGIPKGSAHATVLRHLHTREVCLRESKEASDWSGVSKGGWRGEGGNSIMCKAQRKGHYRIISFSPHNSMSQAQLHSLCNDNGVQNCRE